jgi:hypothetical protein
MQRGSRSAPVEILLALAFAALALAGGWALFGPGSAASRGGP